MPSEPWQAHLCVTRQPYVWLICAAAAQQSRISNICTSSGKDSRGSVGKPSAPSAAPTSTQQLLLLCAGWLLVLNLQEESSSDGAHQKTAPYACQQCPTSCCSAGHPAIWCIENGPCTGFESCNFDVCCQLLAICKLRMAPCSRHECRMPRTSTYRSRCVLKNQLLGDAAAPNPSHYIAGSQRHQDVQQHHATSVGSAVPSFG